MSAKLGSDQSEFNNYYANIALRKTFFPYAKQILLLVTKGLLAEFYSTILRWAGAVLVLFSAIASIIHSAELLSKEKCAFHW